MNSKNKSKGVPLGSPHIRSILVSGPSTEPTQKSREELNNVLMLAKNKYFAGIKYLKGEGVNRSPLMAKSCIEQAANLGYPPAQYALGLIQLKRMRNSVDLGEIIYWLSLAAMQGHHKAKALLLEVECKNKRVRHPES